MSRLLSLPVLILLVCIGIGLFIAGAVSIGTHPQQGILYALSAAVFVLLVGLLIASIVRNRRRS